MTIEEMTIEEKNQKLQELKNDQAFISKLSECKSGENLMEVFSEHGINFSEDELEIIKKMAEAEQANGELSEEALENVSGGVVTLCALAMSCVFVACGSQVILSYLGYLQRKSKRKN